MQSPAGEESLNDYLRQARGRLREEVRARRTSFASRQKPAATACSAPWAAGLLGKRGADADAYVRSVIEADFEQAGDEDVFRKLRRDFDAAKVPNPTIRFAARWKNDAEGDR
jgi:hypothetical protein